MKLHRNARTTPAARVLLVQRVIHEQWTYAEVAEGSGISVRTVAKWVRRYRQGGTAALEDRSSRPGAPRHQTPAAVVARIRHLREHEALAGLADQPAAGLPALDGEPVAAAARAGTSRAVPRPPVLRYERATPGELLHVDIKPSGRFRQAGHRVHGDRQRHRGSGGIYAHVAIDDHSRLSYVGGVPDQMGACAAFLDRAVGWFAAQGGAFRRVMSDNGSGYVSRVFAELSGAGAAAPADAAVYAAHETGRRALSRPCNGVAYVALPDVAGARRALHPWLRHYNQGRPHQPELSHPSHVCVRRVMNNVLVLNT